MDRRVPSRHGDASSWSEKAAKDPEGKRYPIQVRTTYVRLLRRPTAAA
jgi:hypothetical protein